MNKLSGKSYSLSRDAGVLDVWLPLGEGRLTVKAGAAETGGRLAYLVARDPRGAAPPLHIHKDADETWHVIEGRLKIYVGDDEFEAGPGDFAYGPRGVPHSFLVTSEWAEFVSTLTPAGGIEGFFAEVGIPVVAGQPHPGPFPLPEDLARKAAVYSVEIVGPPPTLGDNEHAASQ